MAETKEQFLERVRENMRKAKFKARECTELTAVQRQVLALRVQGIPTSEIAVRLSRQEWVIKKYETDGRTRLRATGLLTAKEQDEFVRKQGWDK